MQVDSKYTRVMLKSVFFSGKLLLIFFILLTGIGYGQVAEESEEQGLKKEYTTAVEEKNIDLQVAALHNLGTYYCNTGDYTNSEKNFTTGLKLAQQHALDNRAVRLLNDMVLLYEILGDYDKALELSFHTYDRAVEIGNKTEAAAALSNTANIFLDTEDFAKALEYIDLAIEADEESEFYFSNLMTRAYIMTTLGEINDALEQMDLALAYCEKRNNPDELITIYTGYGNILSGESKYEEALDYHRKAWGVAVDANNSAFMATAAVNMTIQFLELEHYDSAAVYANKGLLLSEEIDNPVYLMDFYEMNADISHNLGKDDEAYAYMRQYLEAYQEIVNAENNANIEIIEAKHQLKLKDQKISLLKIDEQLSNLKIYALVGCVFFLLLLTVLIYRNQKRKRKQEQQLEEAKTKLVQSELNQTNLKKQQLLSELDYKNSELQKLAQSIVQTNDLLDDLKKELKSGGGTKPNRLMQLINVGMHSNKDELERKVDDINSLFYKNIKDKYPDLSENDLRLLSLIRANMTSKEIAVLLSINPKSVDMARYRLRKKMELEKETNLMDFLLTF